MDAISETRAIGPHRVAVGDVQRGAVREFMRNERASIVYSDPPWGEGNLRYWRTHANDATRPAWSEFVAEWTSSVAAALIPGGALFVEMGLRWADAFSDALASVGRPVSARWTTLYGPSSKLLPVALLYSGPSLRVAFDPSAMRGPTLPRECVREAAHAMRLDALPSEFRGSVFDPCCGKGYTARAAVASGMAFRGIELNPKRAAVTMDWLLRRGAL
jgi:hypothetical protein